MEFIITTLSSSPNGHFFWDTLYFTTFWSLVSGRVGDNDANSAPLESKLTFTKIVLIVATIFA